MKWLEKLENSMMALLAVATLCLVSFEVITRYFFPQHLTDWGMEFTIYFTVWAIFIAGAPLVREGRHVRADILLIMLPVWLQRILEILALLVGLAFACFLTWFGYEMVMNAYSLGENSESSMRFPLWIYYLALPVGTALMVIPFLQRLYLYIFAFDPNTMLVTHEQVVRDK
jgi:C4-dicarboxylate transporter DctQ subunit